MRGNVQGCVLCHHQRENPAVLIVAHCPNHSSLLLRARDKNIFALICENPPSYSCRFWDALLEDHIGEWDISGTGAFLMPQNG